MLWSIVNTAVLCCAVLCWPWGWRRPWSPMDLEDFELEGKYWQPVWILLVSSGTSNKFSMPWLANSAAYRPSW